MNMNRKLLAVVSIATIMVTATFLTAGCLSDEDEWDGTIRVAYLQGDIHQVAYFVPFPRHAPGVSPGKYHVNNTVTVRLSPGSRVR